MTHRQEQASATASFQFVRRLLGQAHPPYTPDSDRVTAALHRAEHMARASRDLAMSLDESAVRETVRRVTLPRPGTWCIVDVLEPGGTIQRLPAVHPDPAKQPLAQSLEGPWSVATDDAPDDLDIVRTLPTAVSHGSGAALMRAAHGEANLRILSEIGFGSLLVVPLIARARVLGAMTFISNEVGSAFAPEEIALAVDLAARCAMALDNARMHREADALRLAAVAANKAKSAFLSSMSHELRTPLSAIGGYTEILELGVVGPVTDGQLEAIARIKANQVHLLALITEVLTFAGVDNGQTLYASDEVSMNQAVLDVVEMLGGAALDRGLTIENYGPGEGVNGAADASRVRQILVNLVMNAVKYTPRNGGVITLTCIAEGDWVRVGVADTGPGIPAEKLESIFEPFVQLKGGIADRRGGVGLGLAISRDLARAMRGDLRVTSIVGLGSQFTLTLPRAPNRPVS